MSPPPPVSASVILTRPLLVCECLHWSVFFLNFRVFSASFPCQDSALVEVVLSLTIAGSRQHVAVIKSKEIGEKEWGGKKRLCDDFARKKRKRKRPGGWKENGRLIKWVWKRLVKSHHLWRNAFVLWPENLHTNTHTQTLCMHTYKPPCYSLAQMGKARTQTHLN